MESSAQAMDYPMDSRLRYLNVVLFSLPQFVNLVEVIDWERNNLAGGRIFRRKNVLAFPGVSEDERMRAFFVPRELRPFKDILMVECAEYGGLSRTYYEQYDVFGRATIICDVEGKPLIPTVVPQNMKGGKTAIFQF
ncbi:MAG: hypothetical protein IT292_11085 [Deltaproteobacteria bacterium]|nr:hypothetical protein [Deltaproteobacteria bacterium]